MKISRRKFISGGAAAGALAFLPAAPVEAAPRQDSYATLIDLAKCDGCADRSMPLCVSSCRQGRQADFPDPPENRLKDYWPQKKHEDWSSRRHLTDRFTPYTWIFVQQVTVEGRTISVPRRCMHCDNPPCAKLCPFGVNHKTPEGPVYIDTDLCFGGAKCRTVCPWSVPQRQAGVGLYTLWQDYLPVGGGVMYKCDLCRDRLAEGQKPLCIEACPRQAMKIGRRDAIFAEAKQLKEKYDGAIYGMEENGGTSTVYVSPVSFEALDRALEEQTAQKDLKLVHLGSQENLLKKQNPWDYLALLSPLIGIAAAIGSTWNMKKEDE